MSSANRGMYSKAVSVVVALAQPREQLERAAGGGAADEGRRFDAVSGSNFSTAAVMMPSVPSEPTKRFLRS